MGKTRHGFCEICKVAAALVLFASATLILSEILVRLLNPTPPLQIIRESRIDLIEREDIPVWLETPERMNLECPERYPDSRNLVFCGDSIFFGSGIDTGQEFTRLMQSRLDTRYGPGRWCVINLSQAGYSFEQKKYWLDQFMTKHRVWQAFWEVWPNERNLYRSRGDSIYNLGGLGVNVDELSDVIPGPRWLSSWLFDHSRLFELMALSFQLRGESFDSWCSMDYMPALARLRDVVKGAGGEFKVVLATRLDISFGETVAAGRFPGDWEGRAPSGSCAFSGFSILNLAEMFLQAGVSPEDVRLDECCHYNQLGHEKLADMFFDMLVSTVDGEGVKKTDK